METNPNSLSIKTLWLMLCALLIGTLIGTMGNSIVSIALPSLMDYYSISLPQAVLSITLYTLTFSVLIPVFGSLSKAIGFLRLFVSGMVLVTISSLMCIFAPNYPIFLISRVCIGVGVAVVLPTIMGVISSYFPTRIQGKATGYWALINSLGHAFGPSIGGFLIGHFTWQSIFWINIPLAIASIIVAVKVYPPDQRIPNPSFDWPGAGLMTGMVFSAMMAISLIAELKEQAAQFYVLVAAAVAMLIFLLVREIKVMNPFLDLNLFKKKDYIASIAPISLQAFTQFGLLVSLPVFLIEINNVEKQVSGLIIMSMTLMMAITSPFAGRLTDKWSNRRVCQIGVILVGVGAVLIYLFHNESLTTGGWISLIGCLMIFGTGFGTIQSGSTVAALQASPKEAAGAATGFFHMIRFLSASLGSTIFGLIFEANTKSASGGFYNSFILIIILTAVTIPITFWIDSRKSSGARQVNLQIE